MRAAEAADPIAEGELGALFASVDAAHGVALAVSGGADSLALLVCFARWQRARGGPPAVVLTVDHGLRPESAAEARAVLAAADAHGLPARILVWPGPHPERDIEAAARLARYRLLLGAAREEGADHLLLAHHRDDQAETFLIRLMRGSGLFGLAAMRPVVAAGEVSLVRPFLAVPRSRLAATTAAAGLVPAADPMNRDPRFLRARIRRTMPLLSGIGLDAQTLAAAAGRLAAAADAIEAAADAAMSESVSADAYGIAWVEPRLLEAPEAIRGRVLARILLAVGGEPYPPRGERLAGLLAAMAGRSGRFKRTLAGAVVEGRGRRFAVYRETGRDGLPDVPLRPGQGLVWDHRFAVEIGAGLEGGLLLGALGEDGRRLAGAPAGIPAPPAALAALPAIRRGGRLVAVPALGWGEVSLPVTVCSVLAGRLGRPPSFPDFSGDS